MMARRTRRLAPPSALCLLVLAACGGGGGGDEPAPGSRSGPVPAAALGSSDPRRDIRRAIVIDVSQEISEGVFSNDMSAMTLAFDAPIDADALLRSADGPLSLLEVSSAQGCFFTDGLDDLDSTGADLLEGVGREDGAVALLFTPAGSFGEVVLEAGRHDDNYAWLPDGELPSGSHVDVVGGGTPDFRGIPLPHIAAPSRFSLSGYDPSTYDEDDPFGTGPALRPDSELTWDAEEDDRRIALVSAFDIDFDAEPDEDGNLPIRAVICTVADTGRFAFPPAARAWMGDDFKSLPFWSVMRAGWTIAREGDTAALLTRTQNLNFDTLVFP